MQLICMVTASYTLGFLMTKNPWLVFRLNHEISKQNFLSIIYGKMLVIQFHIWKNAYFAIFIHILSLYEIV